MDESPPPDPSSPPPGTQDAAVPPRPVPAPPQPIPRPEPPRPVRGAPPGRPQGGRETDRGRRGPTPPPPARQGVDAAPRDPLRPVELPSRPLERSGEAWIVREAGRTSAGVGLATRAPLVHLIFALQEDPERPLKELLAPGFGIADLTDDELLELLARARPYQERHERQEVFPDTRKKGGKGM